MPEKWWIRTLLTVSVSVAFVVVALLLHRWDPEDAKAEKFPATAAQDAQRATERAEQIEYLKLQAALARGDAGAAEQLEDSGFTDEVAWARTIRKALLGMPPACAADDRFRNADIVRRKTLAAPPPLKFAPHEIGMTKAEVIGLHRRTAGEAVIKLVGLLDRPAAGKRCKLDDPIAIADRIVNILIASKLAPKDLGLSEKYIAWKVRAALTKE